MTERLLLGGPRHGDWLASDRKMITVPKLTAKEPKFFKNPINWLDQIPVAAIDTYDYVEEKVMLGRYRTLRVFVGEDYDVMDEVQVARDILDAMVLRVGGDIYVPDGMGGAEVISGQT